MICDCNASESDHDRQSECDVLEFQPVLEHRNQIGDIFLDRACRQPIADYNLDVAARWADAAQVIKGLFCHALAARRIEDKLRAAVDLRLYDRQTSLFGEVIEELRAEVAVHGVSSHGVILAELEPDRSEWSRAGAPDPEAGRRVGEQLDNVLGMFWRWNVVVHAATCRFKAWKSYATGHRVHYCAGSCQRRVGTKSRTDHLLTGETPIMTLSYTAAGQSFSFGSLKEVLAKANEQKSGDELAGIAAHSEMERVAAKQVLAATTLKQLRQEPVVPYEEDEVTRLIDDGLDDQACKRIHSWTVAELREFLLSDQTTTEDVAPIRRALTGEMAAAVAKVMSNMDLVRAAKKCRVVAKANTTIGLEGVLAARLQPNHPADSVDGILASIFEGLSYGIGDAVIGINPVHDTPESVARVLDATHRLMGELELPTQNCVLSHVTTQMKAIQRGAPAGLIFQSIAGSEKGNTAFGITSEVLSEARELGTEKCFNAGSQVMYFETGQGAELSSNSHNGADQLTMEARCYALARLFDPFLVNDVVGFIGPEYLADGRQMIRAGLEDHFMGKLLGVPMGVDACYTNHMEADQNDLENLTILLAAAGVNYFMGVPMGDDVMLSYQSTSYHDVACLRELMGLRPAPEFERWLEDKGLMKNGRLTEKAGDPTYVLGLRAVLL